MADLAERKDTKEVASTREETTQAAMVPAPAPYPTPEPSTSPEHNPPGSPLSIGKTYAVNELLSPQKMAAIKAENTQRNLESNFWIDVSGYLRWASTLTLMGCLAIVGGSVATAVGAGGIAGASIPAVMAGIGIGLASPAFGICLGIGLAFAVGTMLASQHARKVFTEKTFDVQDFQMQRQAALVGRSVERAVDAADGRIDIKPGQSAWSEKIEPRGATENWAQAVQADKTAQQAQTAETVRA